MRFTYLALVEMSRNELRVAAATCMADALRYWPPGVARPDPDPFVITAVMRSLAGMPEGDLGGHRAQRILPPPSSWLWANIQFTTAEVRVASLVLRSLRAAIRGFADGARQDSVWGSATHSDYRHWVAWLAKFPDVDPADEIMEAQRLLVELERVGHNT
jgi:hypothetical protein